MGWLKCWKAHHLITFVGIPGFAARAHTHVFLHTVHELNFQRYIFFVCFSISLAPQRQATPACPS